MKNAEKFRKKYKAKSNELNELRERIENYDRAKQNDIAAAEAPLKAEIERLISLVQGQAETIADLNEAGVNLQTRLDSALDSCQRHRASRDAWQAKAEAAQPTIDAAKQQVADLQALLDSVRDRMKRKDLEKESAILNRKILAGAVPGRRF